MQPTGMSEKRPDENTYPGNLREIWSSMGIGKGDTIFVSSDSAMLMYDARKAGCPIELGDVIDLLNDVIDLLQDMVGSDGNLIFPTYNWDFCKGKTFDYKKTPSETGLLGQCALERDDFIRTRHPFYSCAVWGKDAQSLYENDYRDSFGPDSIFAWLEKVGAKNLFINVGCEASATFVHFVEEREKVPYRFLKTFTAGYIHPDGRETEESYTMYVRYLDREVMNAAKDLLTERFREKKIVQEATYMHSFFRLLDMAAAYRIVADDIRYNNAARISKNYINHDSVEAGEEMYGMVKRLFPICRSLTGNGVRETLSIIREQLPGLQVHEVPTGTQVMDWVVPREWNIRGGWIKNSEGETIIDFKDNNLHIMGYSLPIHKKVSRDALAKIVHTLPDQPNLIPYVTSYYRENYGFCMSEAQWQSLPEDEYEIYIDSTLEDGSLTYADLIIPGECDEEIMFTTYVCHPSMANNELSGPAVVTQLAKTLMGGKHRYTYRFVFNPETIGSVTYLSRHAAHLRKHLKAGYVLTCCGDCGEFSYVAGRYGDSYADKVAQHLLRTQVPSFKAYTFLDRGSDERQYCSPGVDLPVCSVMRTKYGEYPEYHTSGDDLELVSAPSLAETYDFYMKIVRLIEADGYYKMKCLCEPQLGKRGLYPDTSTKKSGKTVRDMMNCIAYMDGKNDLIDIAERIHVPALDLIKYVRKMQSADLVERALCSPPLHPITPCPYFCHVDAPPHTTPDRRTTGAPA